MLELLGGALPWLLLVGVVAGIVNATIGFGSLLPFVVLTTVFGVPPLTAHIANQTAAPASFLTALLRRRDHDATRPQWLAGTSGALAGAVLLTRLPASWAQHAAPWGVAAGVLLLLVSPLAQHWKAHWQLPGLFGAGLWGGTVGPGVGTLTWACVDGPKAAGTRNALCLPMGAAVTLVLTVAGTVTPGLVRWDITVALAVGKAIGGAIGSALVDRLQRSARAREWLREAVLAASTAALVYLVTGDLIIIPLVFLLVGVAKFAVAWDRRVITARAALLRAEPGEDPSPVMKGCSQ